MNNGLRKIGNIRWSGPLITSVLSITILGAALLVGLPNLLGAVSSPGWDGDPDDVFASLEAAHNRQAEISVRRFQGRSPFVVPGRPRTRPAPPRPEPPKPPTRTAPPPKVDSGPPKTYAGPDPLGVAGPLVFFEGNLRIPVGRESDGVRVIRILGPTRVKLGHRGGEYEVSFLDDDPESVFTPFKSDDPDRLLGRETRPLDSSASEDAASTASPTETEVAANDPPSPPTEAKPTAPAEEPASVATPPASRPWTPSRGERVTVRFREGGQERTLTGEVEYLGNQGGQRTMVIRGEVDGRKVFQRITAPQLIDVKPGDGTAAPTPPRAETPETTDDPDSEEPAIVDEPTESSEEPSDEDDLDAQDEQRLRGLTYAELTALSQTIATRLEEADLPADSRVQLEAEFRLVNELLRETPPEG